MIELPLQAILSNLPLELQPRLLQTEVGDATIEVPLEKILSQLSRGTVRISFGELRQAAPDVFSPENDRDRVLVPLPLGEILSRLNPSLIVRRRVQKHVEVPEHISSPFDPNGQGLVFSVGPASPEPAAPLPARPPRSPGTPLRVTLPQSRGNMTSAPTPPAPAATVPSAPAMIPTPASRAPRDTEIIPAPVPIPMSRPTIPLSVSLQTEAIEQALKQGRISFTWKTLRSWLKPAPLASVSAQDSLVLELPLRVVAPLFLKRQHETCKTQEKVAIDETIPNLFFGFPQAENGAPVAPAAPSTAIATPVDTNYYVWDDDSDRARVDQSEVKRTVSSPGTRFVARYATPNEVVSRAAALEGVCGALIALPDGLMVASQLSADLNGDTIAAFLPQIFGKVTQCTKELRMGELNNLNFTVGNIPWKIFRVNAIFFAAFGKAGQALPTAQLLALATELDHKPK